MEIFTIPELAAKQELAPFYWVVFWFTVATMFY